MAFVEEWWGWRWFLLFGWLLVGLLLFLVLRMDGGDYSGKEEEEEGKEDAEDEVRRRGGGGGDMHRVLRSVV